MTSLKFKPEVGAYLTKLKRFQAFCIYVDNMKYIFNYFIERDYFLLFMLNYWYYFRIPLVLIFVEIGFSSE